MTTSTNRSYDLANWGETQSLLEKAESKMCEQQRIRVQQAMGNDTFSGIFQQQTNDQRRFFTIAELCDSAANETSLQRIDLKAISNILFGSDGLISRSNSRYDQRLMEDIEVGFIRDVVNGIDIGPIITSGRNRLLALQVFMKAAAPSGLTGVVKVRCTSMNFSNRQQVEARIVSANNGSRDMAAAENRERRGGAHGLDTSSRAAIVDSLPLVNNKKAYPPAFGALLKICALERGLEGLTIDQYSATGTTVFNSLLKANKPLGQRIDKDTSLLVQMADHACANLENALPEVLANRERGAKSHKMAKILVRRVAEKFELNVNA